MINQIQQTRYYELDEQQITGKLTPDELAEMRTLWNAVNDRQASLRGAARRGTISDDEKAELDEIYAFLSNRPSQRPAEMPNAGSLDYVGLNIAGQKPEPHPELPALTEDDKSLLDSIADTGASLAALAEIESSLRSGHTVPQAPDHFPNVKKSPLAQVARPRPLHFQPDNQEANAQKNHERTIALYKIRNGIDMWDSAQQRVARMIELIQVGTVGKDEIQNEMTSVFFAFPAQTTEILSILDHWTLNGNYVDGRAVPELEALKPGLTQVNLIL